MISHCLWQIYITLCLFHFFWHNSLTMLHTERFVYDRALLRCIWSSVCFFPKKKQSSYSIAWHIVFLKNYTGKTRRQSLPPGRCGFARRRRGSIANRRSSVLQPWRERRTTKTWMLMMLQWRGFDVWCGTWDFPKELKCPSPLVQSCQEEPIVPNFLVLEMALSLNLLTANNSGLKPSKLENYNIFGMLWTSAFSWYTLFRSY